MEQLIRFGVAAGTMLAFDAVWLTTMSDRFYKKYMGDLVAAHPNFWAAGVFYALYVIGVLVLIINPAMKDGSSLLRTFLMGAVFGLVAYATYDLTNQATLRNWPTIVTAVDLVWGTLLTGTVAVISVKIIRAL